VNDSRRTACIAGPIARILRLTLPAVRIMDGTARCSEDRKARRQAMPSSGLERAVHRRRLTLYKHTEAFRIVRSRLREAGRRQTFP
jgi:hypothetical protein